MSAEAGTVTTAGAATAGAQAFRRSSSPRDPPVDGQRRRSLIPLRRQAWGEELWTDQRRAEKELRRFDGGEISRGIVEAHAGRLWAAPSTGSGAVFRFTLPAIRLP